ncbi:MAG TPA: hypothetical protein VK866_06090 [Acidimicrobiales bacterium]|nr:hypothetical protein [Acidimicrobiales bacterium]
MQELAPGRYRLRDALAAVAADPPSPVDGAVLDELRAELESVAAEVTAHLPPDALPLRAPKDRLARVLACERHVLATLGHREIGEAMVRGAALDHVVGRHVLGGAGLDPAVEVAREGLRVGGADDLLRWWDDQPADVDTALREHLERAAELLVDGWGPIDPAWWPRPQVEASVVLAEGAVVCSGRFDLLLGGPVAGLPGVLVEVKSGRARPAHRDDLLWYALLTGLRFGWAPALVATWSAADDGLVPLPVSEGALRAAARRGTDGLVRLAELAAGRAPEERAGPLCGWCPDLDRCATGLAELARRADDDDAERWDDEADDDADDGSGGDGA